MDLYPAIDLHAGKVVRASRRDLSRARRYHDDPFAVLDWYLAAGARWVHIVDLDRAFGVADQTRLVGALVKRAPIPVQVGGGLWTAEATADMRDCGVQRILLGARAAADEAALTALAEQFPVECLGLALDVREGRIWARDWPGSSGFVPEELARRAGAVGISVLAVTDVSREGLLAGSDVQGASQLASRTGMAVIVSGGVGALEDLVRIKLANLSGAIVGRALFERRFSLEEALACCSSS